MTNRLFSVDALSLSLVARDTQTLVVHAQGRAPTTGWNHAELRPLVYVSPPEDGMLELDFLGAPSRTGGPTLPIPAPMAAEITLSDVDLENFWGLGCPLTGVRCHAAANLKSVPLSTARRSMPHQPSFHALDRASENAPNFNKDILPLFRAQDWNTMPTQFKPTDSAHELLRAQGVELMHAMEQGKWPKDGPWPEADVALFSKWIAAGSPA
ncbi:MAG: hypothetical protein MK098_07930 [Marinovum sp.]|nr:hypothetical protein [Marinovum sp.]